MRGAMDVSDDDPSAALLGGTHDNDNINTSSQREISSSFSDHSQSPLTKVYKRRWLVLFSFVFLSTMNNATQFAYTPLETRTRGYYDISSIQFTALAVVFMVSGFTTRFIAMWTIDNHGLGLGVFVSAALNLVGGWLRYWPGSTAPTNQPDRLNAAGGLVLAPHAAYAWLMVGQCLCAIAQGFIDIAGPKIAANWFPPKERTTATALAQGPIFLAALLCYTVAPATVKSTGDMAWYNLAQAVLMTVSAVYIFWLFRGEPPIPPSHSAASEKLQFGDAVKVIFKNTNFIIMFVVFAIALGSTMSLFINLDAILKPKFSNEEADTLGVVWISSAMVGGLFGGLLVDRYRFYKEFILVSLSGSAVTLTIFAVLLHVTEGKQFVLMAVTISAMGFTACSLPAILEATIETIYPIPEATALGFLFLGLNIFGALLTLGMTEEIDLIPKDGGFFALLVTVVFIALSVVLVALFKPVYRRTAYEKRIKKSSSIVGSPRPSIQDFVVSPIDGSGRDRSQERPELWRQSVATSDT